MQPTFAMAPISTHSSKPFSHVQHKRANIKQDLYAKAT